MSREYLAGVQVLSKIPFPSLQNFLCTVQTTSRVCLQVLYYAIAHNMRMCSGLCVAHIVHRHQIVSSISQIRHRHSCIYPTFCMFTASSICVMHCSPHILLRMRFWRVNFISCVCIQVVCVRTLTVCIQDVCITAHKIRIHAIIVYYNYSQQTCSCIHIAL